MVWLLHMIGRLDANVYHFLNGFAGNRFLDRFFYYQESNTLLKCGLLIAMYWYFWFRGGPDQESRRKAILTIIVGALLALAINRVISGLMPFRVRPMYEAALQHRPFSIMPLTDLENWSSFPSDHAAYLVALAVGLIFLSRRLAIPVTLYAAVWICLPRMYLGVHYASDIVVGAAIGVTTVWALLKADWLRSFFASRVLAFADAQPQWFYPAAFLILFEMGNLFWDVRGPAHLVLQAASDGPYHKVIHYTLFAFTILCTAIAVPLAQKRLLGQSAGKPQRDFELRTMSSARSH